MLENTRKWLSGCRTCLANKKDRSKRSDLISPHDIPDKCWEHITADFVTEFPLTEGVHDAVLMVVDKFSKRVVLIPMNKTIDSEAVAHLFEASVFCKFGVPEKITSDRDTKFTAKYWKSIVDSKAIKMNIASTDHPETDGQSERSIQTLISTLRPVI